MSSYGKDPDGPCTCPSPDCPVKRHHGGVASAAQPVEPDWKIRLIVEAGRRFNDKDETIQSFCEWLIDETLRRSGLAPQSQPAPLQPGEEYQLDQSADGLLRRIDDYRTGYSCGYADGKDGTRMRDKDAAAAFFGITGVPDVESQPASEKDL